KRPKPPQPKNATAFLNSPSNAAFCSSDAAPAPSASPRRSLSPKSRPMSPWTRWKRQSQLYPRALERCHSEERSDEESLPSAIPANGGDSSRSPTTLIFQIHVIPTLSAAKTEGPYVAQHLTC